ncbi:MAG: hypothetical protein IJF49_00620 [Clostridia bacterium]|nr:hypothetical protein [Clostridia bacterium]
MTGKTAAAAGIVGGLLLMSAVAVRSTPKMRVRRMTRRAGQTMDAVGSMLQSMAMMTK